MFTCSQESPRGGLFAWKTCRLWMYHSPCVHFTCFFLVLPPPPPLRFLLHLPKVKPSRVYHLLPPPIIRRLSLPPRTVRRLAPRGHGRRFRARWTSPFAGGGQSPKEPPGLPPDGRRRMSTAARLLRSVRCRAAGAAEERVASVVDS